MLSIFQETNQKRFKTCAKLFFKQTNLRTILVSLRFEIITDCPKFEFKDQLWNNLLRHYIEQKGPAVLFQMIFHKFFINILHTVICDCINRFIIYRNFPDKLKLAEKTPIPKNIPVFKLETINQSAFRLLYLGFLKSSTDS